MFILLISTVSSPRYQKMFIIKCHFSNKKQLNIAFPIKNEMFPTKELVQIDSLPQSR